MQFISSFVINMDSFEMIRTEPGVKPYVSNHIHTVLSSCRCLTLEWTHEVVKWVFSPGYLILGLSWTVLCSCFSGSERMAKTADIAVGVGYGGGVWGGEGGWGREAFKEMWGGWTLLLSPWVACFCYEKTSATNLYDIFDIYYSYYHTCCVMLVNVGK